MDKELTFSQADRTQTPHFEIGDVVITGNMALAPMDGVTDSPFRQIAKRFGVNLLFSEFINALDITERNPNVFDKLKFSEVERPIGMQLFDHQPERLLYAARHIVDRYKPDFIDVNLGCSNRRVLARGAGAALLAEPDTISTMISLLSQNLDVPVTAKIRLGVNQETKNYLEISKIIERGGGQAISVHARTISQGMSGVVDWNAVAAIKENCSIPVIGNGSIQNQDQALFFQQQTGCDAIMIGRAAVGNPWIFSKSPITDQSKDIIIQTVLDHLDLSLSHYGATKGLAFFRKHLKQYSKQLNISPKIQLNLLTIMDHKQIISLLKGL